MGYFTIFSWSQINIFSLCASAQNTPCSAHTFICTSGSVKCVPQNKVCDGVDNCEDRSDEHHSHICGGPAGDWFYCKRAEL